MSSIFLSHSSKDNFEAVALRDWLAREGWDDVFLDLDPDRGIAAGERWERALHEQANRCEAVIFLVSANWLASGWCLQEYTLARMLNKKLFAVIVDPAKSIADLPAELKGTWQAVQLTTGQDGVQLATRLPGSHEEKHVVFSKDGLRRLKHGLDKAGLDPKFFAWPPGNDRERAPYRGLKSLEAADAGIFFGRDAPIVEATDRLRGLKAAAPPRLLTILGASGAGKSSFLRAGLWPRLARDDRNFLPLPVIRPERAALTGENGLLHALAVALPHGRAALRKAIEAGASALRPLLVELAGRSPSSEGEKPPTIVLAVDQAEELFRPEGAAEGAALLELIRDLTRGDSPGIIAIFAIRSESYDALLHAEPLEGLAQAALSLPPMPRGAYTDVIEGPARRFGQAGGALTIEPRLTLRLLEDIERGAGSDALPLLAFTLEQLFLDRRREGALRLKDYEDFGGLKGAIDAAVGRAFVRADVDGRIPRERGAREALLRRGLIPWLAGIDPDTKSPRRNIARRSEIPDEAAPLIDLLVEERLLSTDTRIERDAAGAETRVVTIEPAHEALLRQWGLLQGWLEEDFALLATLEGVKRAAREWESNRRAEAWLAHMGQRLAEARALDARADIAAKLDVSDRAYLEACLERERAARAETEARRQEREDEQARRLADARRLAWVTGVGLVAALALAVVAMWQWGDATGQRIAAQQAEREATAQRDRAEQQTVVAEEQRTAAQHAEQDAKTQRDLAVQEKAEADAQRAAADKSAAEAKRQSDRAANALTLATKTANGLITDLAQKFRDVSGVPASLVKDILDRALALQDQLLAAGESSPDLQRSHAAALGETSDTLLTLGDTKDALADASKATKIFESMAREQPDDKGLQRNLSVAYEKVGDVQVAQGDLPAALKSYSDGLAIFDRLAKADPGNAGWQRDLSFAYEKVGDVQVAQGDLPAAVKSYSDGLAIFDPLTKADPGNAEEQRDLSAFYDRVGEVQVAQGDLSAALKSYQDGLAIIDRLAKADSSNAGWQRDLSVYYGRIGGVEVAQGDLPAALKSYQDGLAICDGLAKADPGNAEWQRNLSASYDNVGNVQRDQGDLPDALKSYQDGLAISDRLAKADPGNAVWQRNLSVSYDNVGNVQRDQGDLPAALKSYEDSLAISDRLAKADPGNATWQSDLGISNERVGDVQLTQGDLAAALKSYETEKDIASRLANADPSNAGRRRDLAASYAKVGNVQVAQGDLPAALKSYQDCLAIIDRLAKADAGNAGWQRDLGVSYAKLADVQTKANRPAEARAALDAGRAILVKLVADHPDFAQWKQDLAWFDAQIAALGN
jgi:tetratricopeptide (TPR) repeat protein